MTDIIFSSHGTYAKGIYETLTYFTGDMTGIHYLALGDDSIEMFTTKAKTLLTQCTGEVLVMVDMFQGTPFKTFYTLLHGRVDAKIIANIGFADALSAMIARQEDLAATVHAVVSNNGLEIPRLQGSDQIQDEDDE